MERLTESVLRRRARRAAVETKSFDQRNERNLPERLNGNMSGIPNETAQSVR